MALKDNEYIHCPNAKSDMTPCIARDGRITITMDGVCVGCGKPPKEVLDFIGEKHPHSPKVKKEITSNEDNPEILADLVKKLVMKYYG